MADWTSVAAACAVVFVISRFWKLYDGLKATHWIPGIRCAFDPIAVPGGILPHSWWNPGMEVGWFERFTLYNNADTISIVPFVSGRPQLYTANLDVTRQILSGGVNAKWTKPTRVSRGLLLWGTNLIAAEKEVWRRHRRIVAPAFNNKMNALVWDKTLTTYHEWQATEQWNDQDVVEVDRAQTDIFKFALLIMISCGFGIPTSWSEPQSEGEHGGSQLLSIQEAMQIMSETNLFAAVTPKWVWKLPTEGMRRMKAAYDGMGVFMRSQIDERKAELQGHTSGSKASRDDVFSHMIRANEAESELDGGKQLTLDDEELLANVFILLFAGHETTAHTLSATMALLSLNPDIQEEIYEQIINVIGRHRDPAFEEMEKLDKVTGAFLEALRMFPAAAMMIREATEDTILTIPNLPGEAGPKVCAMPKGSQVTIDVVGLEYNHRNYHDPAAYIPSRWYAQGQDQDSEAVTAFSLGPRACIGQRFATLEATAFLTLLLRDWMIEPKLRGGETLEAWKKRVLNAKQMATLAIYDVPVKFTRRHHSQL